MCCDTTAWSAQNEKQSASFSRVRGRVARCQRDIATRGIKSDWRDVVVSMTPAQLPQPSQMKPVRQCAWCGAVDRDVAQASPLFSDHAPREVHLWQ
jgi:hypothetical protein